MPEDDGLMVKGKFEQNPVPGGWLSSLDVWEEGFWEKIDFSTQTYLISPWVNFRDESGHYTSTFQLNQLIVSNQFDFLNFSFFE